jgi:hypothetical protein
MGIIGDDRFEYWKLIAWVLTQMPKKFPMAITLTVYGYHFRRVAKLHLGNIVETIPKNIEIKSGITQKDIKNATI